MLVGLFSFASFAYGLVLGIRSQLPQLDPRIAALAKSVTAQARTPYDKARAIENHLRSRYSYTLNLSGKPGDDPLAHPAARAVHAEDGFHESALGC